jgi:hypothetical protein
MGGWMARPALVAVLLAVPLLAQRHGASGGFAGHSGPVSRGSFAGHFSNPGHPMMNRGSSFSGSRHLGGPRFGNNFRGGLRSPFLSRSRRFSRFNRPRFFYGVSPWLSYGYPGYYGDPYYDNYDDSSDNSYPAYNYAGGYDNQSGQMEQDKIDRLEGEVAQLREERNSTRSAQAKAEIRASTVLIFRDQHAQEVQNYAIVGDTLWVFDAQKAAKIPVDNLDVPATTKANDDRGLDFRLPGQ